MVYLEGLDIKVLHENHNFITLTSVYFRIKIKESVMTWFLITVCFYAGVPGGAKAPKHGKENLGEVVNSYVMLQ